MAALERLRDWASVLLASMVALCACARGDSERAPSAKQCASCHMPEYLAAKKPVHAGVRPTECSVCHSQSGWKPAFFNHPWPLEGAHAKARCTECHRGHPPAYEHTNKLCVSCHERDFERSDFPGHARFAKTCESCHSTTAWTPAREPAAQKPDGTAGAESPIRSKVHKPAHPAARHIEGESKPRATSPSEPTAAQPLPSPSPAEPVEAPAEPPPARHPEQRFPIATGAHAGIGCRTCHDQGGTMGRDDTDCVQCHARAKFDRIHEGVRGYPAGEAPLNFCLRCHASGRARGR